MGHLEFEGPEFYSVKDEQHFFNWLESIDGILKVTGKGKTLSATYSDVGDSALREIIAIFYRYNLPGRVLQEFETRENANWFRSPSTYWHEMVFK